MKEFSTEGREVKKDLMTEEFQFGIDGKVITVKAATSDQMIYMMQSLADPMAQDHGIMAAVNVFYSLLSSEDVRYFQRRILDENDPVDHEFLSDVLLTAFEEWFDRPLGSDSDSTPPTKSSGQESKANARGGTSRR